MVGTAVGPRAWCRLLGGAHSRRFRLISRVLEKCRRAAESPHTPRGRSGSAPACRVLLSGCPATGRFVVTAFRMICLVLAGRADPAEFLTSTLPQPAQGATSPSPRGTSRFSRRHPALHWPPHPRGRRGPSVPTEDTQASPSFACSWSPDVPMARAPHGQFRAALLRLYFPSAGRTPPGPGRPKSAAQAPHCRGAPYRGAAGEHGTGPPRGCMPGALPAARPRCPVLPGEMRARV